MFVLHEDAKFHCICMKYALSWSVQFKNVLSFIFCTKCSLSKCCIWQKKKFREIRELRKEPDGDKEKLFFSNEK
jgi:hypothetical protein